MENQGVVNQPSKLVRPAYFEPISRDALLAKWRESPRNFVDKAMDLGVSAKAYAERLSPATQDSPGSATEFLLYNEGVAFFDDEWQRATLVKNVPDLVPDLSNKRRDPIVDLVEGLFDEKYHTAKMTGVTTRATGNYQTNLTVGSTWRPRTDDMIRRSPNIAVHFDFRELVAFSEGTNDDIYRTNQWNNPSGEQMMQAYARGTAPKLFEIKRSDNENELIEYRAGIEATVSFLTGNEARMLDWLNAIEEIGIGHRLMLLRLAAKIANDSKVGTYSTSGRTVGTITAEAGKLQFPFWSQFLKEFGTAYNPNIAIGNKKSITDFEMMSFTDGQNLTLGSVTNMPGSRYVSLNTSNDNFNFGWVDNVTELADNQLTVFDRNRALGHVYRLNYNQDATVTDEELRKVRRYVGTQEGIVLLDKYAIRQMSY